MSTPALSLRENPLGEDEPDLGSELPGPHPQRHETPRSAPWTTQGACPVRERGKRPSQPKNTIEPLSLSLHFRAHRRHGWCMSNE